MTDVGRLVICAGRKRSNAMGNYPLVRTVSTTRLSVFLHKSKRRGTHRKGKRTENNI
jgi:hypothetical protein